MFQCSKETIKHILHTTTDILQRFVTDNNKFNGFIVFLFHLFIQLSSGYFLIIYELGNLFYATIVLWVVILFSNLYFRGCILTKIERHLWNTKDWYGPYFLYCEILKLSPMMIHNLFICKTILIITIIFIRILFTY